MLIQDALKETGKARKEDCSIGFVMKNEKGHLIFFNEDGVADGYVVLSAIMSDNWQPYHEVKEIRPEVTGEVWENPHKEKFFTIKLEQRFHFIDEQGHCHNSHIGNLTRIFSPVEDEQSAKDKWEKVWQRQEEIDTLKMKIAELVKKDLIVCPQCFVVFKND